MGRDQDLKNEPAVSLGPITHGNALSVYFHDPEKNRVELLIDTPWYVPQPYRVPYDIMLPDADTMDVERWVTSYE